jgi:hypothetical protein
MAAMTNASEWKKPPQGQGGEPRGGGKTQYQNEIGRFGVNKSGGVTGYKMKKRIAVIALLSGCAQQPIQQQPQLELAPTWAWICTNEGWEYLSVDYKQCLRRQAELERGD